MVIGRLEASFDYRCSPVGMPNSLARPVSGAERQSLAGWVRWP